METTTARVWAYKTFSELSPEAAQRAIEDDRLFSATTPWGLSMDPNTVDTLYRADGQAVSLTVTERARRFPQLRS